MSHHSEKSILIAQDSNPRWEPLNPLIILCEIYIELARWIEVSHSVIETDALRKVQMKLEQQVEGVLWKCAPDDPQEVLNWIDEVFHDYRVNQKDTPFLVQALFANPLLDRREDPRL